MPIPRSPAKGTIPTRAGLKGAGGTIRPPRIGCITRMIVGMTSRNRCRTRPTLAARTTANRPTASTRTVATPVPVAIAAAADATVAVAATVAAADAIAATVDAAVAADAVAVAVAGDSLPTAVPWQLSSERNNGGVWQFVLARSGIRENSETSAWRGWRNSHEFRYYRSCCPINLPHTNGSGLRFAAGSVQ